MSETSGFFNAQLVDDEPDRAYEATDFANYYANLIANGVFANPSTNLQVTAQNGKVVVKSGDAYINGYWYKLSENMIFDVESNKEKYPRWDTVLLTLNLASREILLSLAKGSISASKPKISLVREDNKYQLCLAQIIIPPGITSISNSYIYDTRQDNTVCGLVTGLVDQIDTTNLFQQFDASFSDWFDDTKYKLDNTPAAKLQAQIDAMNKQNPCYGYANFEQTSAEIIYEETTSSSVGHGSTITSKTAGYALGNPKSIKFDGSLVEVIKDVNAPYVVSFKFTSVGVYKFTLQLSGKISFDKTDGLGASFNILFVSKDRDCTLVKCFVNNQSFDVNGETFKSSANLDDGNFYGKEIIVEITEEHLNKDFYLIFEVQGASFSSDFVLPTMQLPQAMLLIEALKPQVPIPQDLIGFVKITEDAYNELVKNEDINLDTLYFVFGDSGKVKMYYAGSLMSSGSGGIAENIILADSVPDVTFGVAEIEEV